MARIEKTVFISYRRTNAPWALAISQNLTHNGYDVFFDYTGLASGDFESVILENIHSRAHFLVLLTPSALERCNDPSDWLRLEIETALDSKRNIVPLMLEGFDFGTPSIANQLTGKLALLDHYNALEVRPAYVFEAMSRLREKYLSVSLDAVPHPASLVAQQAATEQKDAAATAPPVSEEELTAQQWFEQGFNAKDLNEQIRLFTEAIRLQPDFVEAFNNRGNARNKNGDLAGAIADYDEAIRLKPDIAEPFLNRGSGRAQKGDLDGALKDYDEAIRLKPDFSYAFYGRGLARCKKGDLDGAFKDYDEAIRLKPDYAEAICDRGVARKTKGDLDTAIAEYDQAIRLKPDYAIAFNNRGAARYDKGDSDGAFSDFDEAIRLKPDYALAFNNRGSARDDKGDFDAALADYDEAIRLQPDLAPALSNRELVHKAIAARSKT